MRSGIANKFGLTRRCRWSLGFALFLSVAAAAQVPAPSDPLSFSGPKPEETYSNVRIEQKLGETIPLELKFRNEAGEEVALREYFGHKPVVLALVYYECPMLCGQIMNGMVDAFMLMEPNIGEAFEVVCVSIDPGESSELAAMKKESVLARYNRPSGTDGWHFLTGEEDAIEMLAATVGYGYAYDPKTDQYAHASGIMVATPQGKLAQYLLGVEYNPSGLRKAIEEAAASRLGSFVDQLILLCYHWDPKTGQYSFYVMGALRVAAVATLLPLFGFIGIMVWRDNRRRGKTPPPGNAPASS
jgi:protein SCO1/2